MSGARVRRAIRRKKAKAANEKLIKKWSALIRPGLLERAFHDGLFPSLLERTPPPAEEWMQSVHGVSNNPTELMCTLICTECGNTKKTPSTGEFEGIVILETLCPICAADPDGAETMLRELGRKP